MLRFYSYYSLGGYKDLYLGNSEMKDEFTYLLPLLEIQRNRAEEDGDEKQVERIKYLDSLPKVLLVNQNSSYGFPEAASRLISHGGYKLVYTHIIDDCYVLVLREISGDNKDETGHSVPFLIMIVADDIQEAKKLATIAAFWSNNIDSVSVKIASMLIYDKEVNGIKFCLRQFNEFIKECANRQDYVETTLGKIVLKTECNTTGILIMSSELYTKRVIEDLGLNNKRIKHVSQEQVLPLDNPNIATKMREKAHEVIKLGKRKLIYASVIMVIIVGIIVILRSNSK